MKQEDVVLRLGKHEALVLFEWIAGLEVKAKAVFQHASEERVLWKLQGQLESTLSEPFAANYVDILAEARRMVESDKA
jgi:hypothetical protein